MHICEVEQQGRRSGRRVGRGDEVGQTFGADGPSVEHIGSHGICVAASSQTTSNQLLLLQGRN